MKRSALLAGAPLLLALTLATGTGCSVDTAHRADLKPGWHCEIVGGQPHAAGSVTNHSSKASTYMVEIS